MEFVVWASGSLGSFSSTTDPKEQAEPRAFPAQLGPLSAPRRGIPSSLYASSPKCSPLHASDRAATSKNILPRMTRPRFTAPCPLSALRTAAHGAHLYNFNRILIHPHSRRCPPRPQSCLVSQPCNPSSSRLLTRVAGSTPRHPCSI